MTEPLQNFGFRDSSYERAEQPWECGRLEGGACAGGPGRNGACGGRTACRPLRDGAGGGYRCARLKEDGGACTEGPSASGVCCLAALGCQPVRSVRSRRGLVVRLSFLCTLGLLLALLFGPARDEFVSPGDLSDPHHRLDLACSACHGAAEGSAASWLHWAVDVDTSRDLAARCEQCHQFVDHGAPQNPHGLPTDHIRALQASLADEPGVGAPKVLGELRCGACHQEHGGRERRLTPSSDADCQACHMRTFTSFTQGHPEFSPRWPLKTRNPVAFDHKAHYGGLFAQGASSAGSKFAAWGEPLCTLCHVPDADGRDMRPRFEAHCQVCHGGQVGYTPDSVDGIALRFAQFPMFEEEARPEGWPEALGAPDPSEVSISPEMEILLGRDRETVEKLLARMPEDERSPEGFLEMGEEAKPDVSAFLLAMKAMLVELGQTDRTRVLAAVARRFKESLGVELAAAEQERLWPPALQERAAQAQRLWFDEEGEDTHEDGFAFGSENFSLDLVPTFQAEAPARAHGNPTLQAWAPYIFAQLERGGRLEGERLVRAIPAGLQRCLKCHNVDRGMDQRLHVDWSGREKSRGRRLDRFVHAPHLGQDLAALREAAGKELGWADIPSLKRNTTMLNCLTCHVPTKDDAHDDFFVHFFTREGDKPPLGRTNARDARANFGPIARALCASCHTQGKARSDCLTCHVYHPGPRATRAPKAR